MKAAFKSYFIPNLGFNFECVINQKDIQPSNKWLYGIFGFWCMAILFCSNQLVKSLQNCHVITHVGIVKQWKRYSMGKKAIT